MSNAGGHPYQPQIISGGQNQAFNPYNSYASSDRTYYDATYNSNSKPSTMNRDPEFQRPNSPYGSNGRYTMDGEPGASQSQNYYGGSKQPYAPGGYAQGPPRTPSPTPSELEEAKAGVVDWKTVLNWRTYAHKKYIPWFIGSVVILVLVALMTLYHKQIVDWLTPVANWMHKLKYGYLIPIAIMFVISFPPLFGHEIVAILCGLVWGLGIGFAIVAAGTLIGEIGNFYAFKYCCHSRGEKLERDKLSYACLARVVREGGFKIALIARLSAIPGHFTTAVFSVCGMGIFTFVLAATLSLPKQFITVYLGVILEQSNDTKEQQTANKNSRIISDSVLAVTFVITVAACWYIWREMNKVQPAVLKERRLAKRKLQVVPPAETQHLARASNADLSSEEEMTPVKPNEPRMGAYGYSGFARSDVSHETYNTYNTRQADERQKEAWEMKDPRANPHAYPPAGYNDPYAQPQQQQQQSYHPYSAQPYTSQEDSSSYRHSKSPTNPPQIQDVPNLTGPRRAGREGWEGTESTVGMGSWGGILKDEGSSHSREPSYGSKAVPHPAAMTPGSPTTPRPSQAQQQFAQPTPQRQNGADEYGILNTPSGLSALGAPLSGAGTVSVIPRNVAGARQSVEQPGLVGGKSMRAIVESSHGHDTDLGYMQASPPNSHMPRNTGASTASSFSQAPPYAEPGVSASGFSGGYHTAHGTDPSQGTFGEQKSLHSREFASTGSASGDERYIPGAYR